MPDWLADDLDAHLLTHPRRTEPTAPLFPARVRAEIAQLPVTSERPNPRADLTTAFDWDAPIEPGTFLQRRFRPALQEAAKRNPDLPTTVRLHDLRHSYGTNLRIAGRALDEISRLMGHASLAITHELYVHDDPARFHRRGQRPGRPSRSPTRDGADDSARQRNLGPQTLPTRLTWYLVTRPPSTIRL